MLPQNENKQVILILSNVGYSQLKARYLYKIIIQEIKLIEPKLKIINTNHFHIDFTYK